MSAAVRTDNLVDEVVRRLAIEFRPVAIYLFGSRVWGEPDEDSDADFLVVVPESHETPAARAARAYECVQDIMMPMDILVQTREESERYLGVVASLARKVAREGRLVYG
jgi:predicted nucleotidyltransferase